MNNSPRGNGFDQYTVTIETHCLNRHTITADTDEGVSGQEGMGAKDPTRPMRSGGAEGAPEGAPPATFGWPLWLSLNQLSTVG